MSQAESVPDPLAALGFRPGVPYACPGACFSDGAMDPRLAIVSQQLTNLCAAEQASRSARGSSEGQLVSGMIQSGLSGRFPASVRQGLDSADGRCCPVRFVRTFTSGPDRKSRPVGELETRL